jgi:hypothetical protein
VRTRRLAVLAAAAALAMIGPMPGAVATSAVPDYAAVGDYTVLVERGADRAAAEAAVVAAGGSVIRENAAIGALVVNGPAEGFVERVTASDAVFGATHGRPIGHAPAGIQAIEHPRVPAQAGPGDPLDGAL